MASQFFVHFFHSARVLPLSFPSYIPPQSAIDHIAVERHIKLDETCPSRGIFLCLPSTHFVDDTTSNKSPFPLFHLFFILYLLLSSSNLHHCLVQEVFAPPTSEQEEGSLETASTGSDELLVNVKLMHAFVEFGMKEIDDFSEFLANNRSLLADLLAAGLTVSLLYPIWNLPVDLRPFISDPQNENTDSRLREPDIVGVMTVFTDRLRKGGKQVLSLVEAISILKEAAAKTEDIIEFIKIISLMDSSNALLTPTAFSIHENSASKPQLREGSCPDLIVSALAVSDFENRLPLAKL